MACELLTPCILIFGILKCTLPEDTIDVDLKVHVLRGIHTFKKDGVNKSSNVALGELRSSPTHH